MAEIVTPYTSQDLFLTKVFDNEFANELVSRSVDGPQPFPRKIDLWWVAVVVGAALGHRTPLASCLALLCSDQDLAQVAEAWPRLSATCKRVILDAVGDGGGQ